MRSSLACSLMVALAACSPQAPREAKGDGTPNFVDHDLDKGTQDPRCGGIPESLVDTTWMQRNGILPRGSPNWKGHQPWAKTGLVSNGALAKQLAAPILASEYPGFGNAPLHAQLKNGVWLIDQVPPREQSAGGILHLEICQSNGRILNLYAGQ